MTTPMRPLAALLVDSVTGTGKDRLGPELTALSCQQVVDAALLHRVTPAVVHRVMQCDDAPPDWLPLLSRLRHAQLMRLLRARTELLSIGRALDGAGIGWVAIKGPVAADVLWPRPDLREFYDLDLLIDPVRFDEALGVLRQAGATDVDRNWPLLARTMRAEIAMRGPWGTPLDVHWDIAVPPRLRQSFRIDVGAMLARRVRVQLGDGSSAWSLDPADTLLHLAFHAAQAGMSRLLWAADVAFAAARLPEDDWPELVRRVRRARIEIPVALVLRRAVSFFPDLSVDPRALEPAYGPWGRLVAARDVAVPFPGLPGDQHLGGTLYAAARRSPVVSAATALADRVRLWQIERGGTGVESESEALEHDVMDQNARSQYLSAVLEYGRR